MVLQNKEEDHGPPRSAEEGEISSLWGHINISEFGSRAERDKPNIKQRSIPSSVVQQKEEEPLAIEEIATLHYRPRTTENRVVYERLLAMVISITEADSGTLARALLDEALPIILSPALKDTEKMPQLEEIFSSPITNEQMIQLIALAKQLSDYHAATNAVENYQQIEEEEEAFGLTVVDQDSPEEGDFLVENMPDTEDYLLDATYGLDVGDNRESREAADHEFEKEERFVDIRDVDAHYLQRLLALPGEDAWESLGRATAVLALLQDPSIEDGWVLETKLSPYLFHPKRTSDQAFDLLSLLITNRLEIAGGVALASAADGEEREAILQTLISKGPRGAEIASLAETPRTATTRLESLEDRASQKKDLQPQEEYDTSHLRPLTVLTRSAVEAEALANRHLSLPPGSFRRTHAESGGYEEVVIPAPTNVPSQVRDAPLLLVSETLPSWTWPAWTGMSTLNRIQSAVFEDAFHTSSNLLVAAPTGAGKTGIALLALLRLFGAASSQTDVQNEDIRETKRPRIKRTLAVYVAPMRALVAEMRATFAQRLGSIWGPNELAVDELTGESEGGLGALLATSSAPLRLIVTTPEKWDVVSRKATVFPSLLVIDEVHLLGDEMRGPALEALVARHLRDSVCRIIALSATLPNSNEVAGWLRDAQLHQFGPEWRPAPLELTFFGLHVKKATKRLKAMNDILLKELVSRLPRGPAIVFVHSRRETGRLARFLRDSAAAAGTLGAFTPRESVSVENQTFMDAELRELTPSGIGIHHAGLVREDRAAVERLFAEGMLSVLVSTATLAWGVNLPAHTVFIRGTDIYQEGSWRPLSSQDVLQMWGRAGRPQYDRQGEAVLMTSHEELSRFIAISVQPIHSKMLSRGGEPIAKHMGAEIARGAIRSIADGIRWVEQDLFIGRQLSALGGINAEELVFAAVALLQQRKLISFGGGRQALSATPLGTVSADFYLETESGLRFSTPANLTTSGFTGYEAVLEVISETPELRILNTTREEEALALEQLTATLPLPGGQRRVAILLQAIISRVPLERHWTTLATDAALVATAAPRLLRALFAILTTCFIKSAVASPASKDTWAKNTQWECSIGTLAMAALRLARSVEKRAWPHASVIVQLDPEGRFSRLARRDLSLPALRALTATELASANLSTKSSNNDEAAPSSETEKSTRALRRALATLPCAELSASAIPLTPNLLSLTVVVRPDWEGDASARFHLLITDLENDVIFHYSSLRIYPGAPEASCRKTMTVPITRPLPPGIMIHLLSDAFHHCDTRLPISFRSLVLPADTPEPIIRIRELAPVSHTAVQAHYNNAHFSHNSSDHQSDTGADEQLLSPIERHVLWLLRAEKTSLVIGLPFSVFADHTRIERLLEYGAGFAAPKREPIIICSPYHSRRIAVCSALSNVGFTVINGDNIAQSDAIATQMSLANAISQSRATQDLDQNVMVVGDAALLTLFALKADISTLVLEWDCGSTPYQELLLGIARKKGVSIILLAPSSLSSLRSLGEWIGASSGRILSLPDYRQNSLRRIPCRADDIMHHIIPLLNEVFSYDEKNAPKNQPSDDVPNNRKVLVLSQHVLNLCERIMEAAAAGSLRLPMLEHVIEERLSGGLVLSPQELEMLAAGIAIATDFFSLDLFKAGALNLLIAPPAMIGELLATGIRFSQIIVIHDDDTESSHHLSMALAYPNAILLTSHPETCPEQFMVIGESVFADPSLLALTFAAQTQNTMDMVESENEMQQRMDWVCEVLWLPTRLSANPNYYHLAERNTASLSAFLSELIEEASGDVLAVDGRIALHYQLTTSVSQLVRPNLGPATRSKGLLSIVAAATKLELGLSLEAFSSDAPTSSLHMGTLLDVGLYISSGSRGRLDACTLSLCERILRAAIDVCIAGDGSLPTALAAMDLVQALRQGISSVANDDVILQQQLGLASLEEAELLQNATGVSTLGELALLVRDKQLN